eukprot:scaffold16951_cov48-Attheya_sp.AAC.7
MSSTTEIFYHVSGQPSQRPRASLKDTQLPDTSSYTSLTIASSPAGIFGCFGEHDRWVTHCYRQVLQHVPVRYGRLLTHATSTGTGRLLTVTTVGLRYVRRTVMSHWWPLTQSSRSNAHMQWMAHAASRDPKQS